MIAEGDGLAAPNATTHDILCELKSCRELGHRLNACVARQLRDRCGGRFFGPELVAAVQGYGEGDADHVSDNDYIALAIEENNAASSTTYCIGFVEKMSRYTPHANQKFTTVQQLSINDEAGRLRVRLCVPKYAPDAPGDYLC